MPSVLLVDDNDIFRDATQKNLEQLGYRVLVAENGRIAQEILKKTSVNVVVSDIRMPEVDGIQLTKYVKSATRTPVVLITGFAEILEAKDAYAWGADEFIPKPFTSEDLEKVLQKCLREKLPIEMRRTDYCKLGIDDFISGRQIKYNIFARLSENKYIKVAHKGEDVSHNRIRSYKERGVVHLYLQREDFCNYVGFSPISMKEKKEKPKGYLERKIKFLEQTTDILRKQIRREGVSDAAFDSATTFVETVVELLTEDPSTLNLLEALNQHADHLFAHSLGVSLFSTMIAQKVNWKLPTNRFKVAMSGLLHDVGYKEISKDIIKKSKVNWTPNEAKTFEEHPVRGLSILKRLENIPEDVLQIVYQHHEDCLAHGYPAKLKKSAIHPMAKLIMVADEFCYRTIKNPDYVGMTPVEAIQDMTTYCQNRMDRQFFEALIKLFQLAPTKMSYA